MKRLRRVAALMICALMLAGTAGAEDAGAFIGEAAFHGGAETREDMPESSGTSGPEEGAEALSFSGEEEHDGARAFVKRCYWLILGREPDPAGLEGWTAALKDRTATAAQVISGFLRSREFTEMGRSAEALVEILYRTMLNRASDEVGRHTWLSAIAGGFSLSQLINGFSGSAEFGALCAGYGIESGRAEDSGEAAYAAFSSKLTGFVTRCYREALGRDPDAEGLRAWCGALTDGSLSFRQVAAGFVFSAEMEARRLSPADFIRTMYRLYLGREAEEAGLVSWVQQLEAGAAREQVNAGFAESPEFQRIIASYDPEAGLDPEYDYILVPGDPGMIVKNGATVRVRVSPEAAAPGEAMSWFSSDEKIFTVSGDGAVFGVYPGTAELTVTGKNGRTAARIRVTVQANYRAVLFSESTFSGSVIHRNRGDVRLMKEMLSAVHGPDGGQYIVSTFDDLEADRVYEEITRLLINPSREGDVSMFFFASHGDYRSRNREFAGRLWCRDKRTWLELPTLAERLSTIRGKVIVLLESCGPGAAVLSYSGLGESDEEGPEELWAGETDSLAEAVSVFAAADPGLTVYRPSEPGAPEDASESISGAGEEEPETAAGGNLFRTKKFVVMTASAYLQASYSIGSDTSNLFPTWLVRGVGTAGEMPADTECGDGNGELQVQELYRYVYEHTVKRQTPQVYPENCEYVLFVR